jgi:hypothetical protein
MLLNLIRFGLTIINQINFKARDNLRDESFESS